MDVAVMVAVVDVVEVVVVEGCYDASNIRSRAPGKKDLVPLSGWSFRCDPLAPLGRCS